MSGLLPIMLLACMWGPSFLFIKISGQEIPPLTLTLLRTAGAVILLFPLLRFKGVTLPKFGIIWGHMVVMALLATVLPFSLINYAELTIDSALMGIVNGLVPLFVAILAHFTIISERLTSKRIFGILLGLTGFTLLMLETLADQLIVIDSWSMLLAGLSSLCYALGMIYARRYLYSLTTLVAPALQLILATLITLPLALMLEQPWQLTMPSLPVIFSVLMLSFWGTAAGFIMYFHILRNYGAVALSLSIYLMPLFSIVLGVFFLDEHLSRIAYFAAALILVGMVLVNNASAVEDKR